MNSQATQSSALLDFLAWVELNKKRLILGVATVAVIALAVGSYRWYSRERETTASRALSDLRPSLVGSSTAPAPKVQEYLSLAKSYPRTSAAEQALLLAASGLFREGKYQDAQTQFENFLRDHGDSEFAPEAAYGVAACLDAQNQLDAAVKKYQEVVTRYPNSATTGQAKLALGRLYEAKGQPELALKQYDELTREKTPSQWGAEARARRELLQQTQPALAPAASTATNIISTPPPPAPKS